MRLETSPSGQPTCPSVGPLDAEIVLVGESPASNEIREQQPFIGQAGRILDIGLRAAGIDRAGIRLINTVPCQAPGNTFERHAPADIAWGHERLANEMVRLSAPKVIVALGNHAMEALMGLHGVTKWRGSLFPPEQSLVGDRNNEYWTLLSRQAIVPIRPDAAYMATFHPSAVQRQMPWHIWFINDLTRVKRYTEGRDHLRRPRSWHFNDLEATERIVYDTIIEKEHLVAVDTEMVPPVVALVTEHEVTSFEFDERYRRCLTDLMSSKWVLKVAHNMAHDWRQFEKVFEIAVEPPYYDTIAGAHIMEPSGIDPGGDRQLSAGEQRVGKSLSPHLSTKYTGWPHHKWLVDYDDLLYCGMDTVVCYDAYWSEMEELYQPRNEQKRQLVEHDIKLFTALFAMQRVGLRVDLSARDGVLSELLSQTQDDMEELQHIARPYQESALLKRRLKKPHLTMRMKRCKCCNNSSKKDRCWSCVGFDKAPSKRQLMAYYQRTVPLYMRPSGWQKLKKQELEQHLPSCQQCDGLGQFEEWYPLNPDSPDQVADLFYRAFGIPPRRFEGKVTTRIEQLERLLDPGGLLYSPDTEKLKAASKVLKLYSQWNRANNDLVTVSRLTPGPDGRVRCNFDPWYTPTSRVASRESLLDEGTNVQNIPKQARRLIIASPGHFLMYPDYKQLEGRTCAVASQDQKLLEIYRQGLDSHAEVARLVTEAGTPITRDQAKRTTFSTFYGVGANHLGDILGIPVYQAQRIISTLLAVFSGIPRFHRDVERQLREHRSVICPDGWERRWLGYILHVGGRKKGQLKDKVKKEAYATVPQYMGARIMGLGLLQLIKNVPWITPVAHVHDASLAEIPNERAAEAILEVEKHMTVDHWGMTFPVDASCGPNWLVASMSDKEKEEKGYGAWTREAILANGVPDEYKG